MIGRRLSHYQITAKLGSGGMGEVYLAEDTRLGRMVALKVLPVELAGDPDRLRRFEREARALGALDHPNIVTVHSVEEAEGVHFLTMSHVEGQTLGQLIPVGGLSVDRLLELATALAEALCAAHEKGIIHRDLKPGNVMIDASGRLRVLDFGLAKLVAEPSAQPSGEEPTHSLSQEGLVVGTVPYMSPEQLEGRAVDARSDLFSFGVMLHEMATGHRPFGGDSAMAVASAILKDDPPRLTQERPELPEGLALIVGRCLEKRPDRRISSAAELLRALKDVKRGLDPRTMAATTSAPAPTRRTWRLPVVGVFVLLAVLAIGLEPGGLRQRLLGTGDTEPDSIRSIAVLPFDNVSGDPDQEYFADGMTEALITDLSKVGTLKVISRTSAMRYKGTAKSIPEISRELGVDAVVEGSVVREANRVRVTAQLIHAASDSNLWAERYERDVSSILALQNALARQIVGQIELQLTPQEQARLTTTRTVDPAAYEATLRGVFHRNRFTPRDFETALQYFRSAIAKDPDSAAAHAGAGSVWAYRLVMGLVPTAVACPLWGEELTRALELDPSSAEARLGIAQFRSGCQWNWEAAESEFQRAIELNPGYAEARTFYANFLGSQRRFEEAEPHMRRALELDPLNAFYRVGYGIQLRFERRYPEALVQLERALELDPGIGIVHGNLADVLKHLGREDEALEQMKLSLALRGETGAVEALTTGAAAGGYQEAMRRAAESLAAGPAAAPKQPMAIAELFDEAGDTDQTLAWLYRAYEVKDLNLSYLAVAGLSDAVLTDVRYLEMLRRLDLPIPPPAETEP